MAPLLTPLNLETLSVQARTLLGPDIDRAYCFCLPLKRRFRRIDVREGVLIHGPAGWGEISPFWDYGPRESFQWAFAGIEAATTPPPTPLVDTVPVNVTIPVVSPDVARQLVRSAGGCTTAKVKVADPGVSLEADEARIAAVRETFDDLGLYNAAIRIDANAAWDVDQGVAAITRLDKAARGVKNIGLQYAEQPCATTAELAAVRRLTHVPIAADESLRRAHHPRSVIDSQAADHLIVKVHPFGGIGRIIDFLGESSLPVTVSSAVDSSVGLHRGALLAACLSDNPPACGLGTGLMFPSDIATPRVLPKDGAVSTTPPVVDDNLATTTDSDICLRWAHRLDRIGRYAEAHRRSDDGDYEADAFAVHIGPSPSPRPIRTGESDATNAARATVMALIAAGVRDIVICPGSRNAPLTYAVKQAADAGLVRVHVRIDERSAAFFALGLSKSGRAHRDGVQSRALSGCVPVALMMTSGTAVMNMHPAIAEASHSWVPLVVVSADRPASLRGTAANQTTDQTTIFGSQIRWSADVPDTLPDGVSWNDTMAYLVREGLTIASGGHDRDPGPIQLNMQFSNPLVENKRWRPTPIDLAETGRLMATAWDATPDHPRFGVASQLGTPATRGPWSRSAGLARVGEQRIFSQLSHAINPALTTVIVACDPGAANRHAAASVLRMAEQTGWLVCAEPSSGIRAGRTTPCDYQSGLLHLATVATDVGLTSTTALVDEDALAATDAINLDGIEQVIVLGHPTLSRPISRLVESLLVRQIRISPWGTVCDTGHVADAIVTHIPDAGQVDTIINAVHKVIEAGSSVGQRQQRLNATVMAASHPSDHFMFFGQAVKALWDRHISTDTTIPLIVGSSNAIRILDRCAQPAASVDDLPFILTNRGLAGIDGTIATALGVATGLQTPVRAIMGDITFLHDSSSLLRGDHEPPATAQIFVLNDHGGAIFRDLEHGQPHRRHAFDRFFLTPQRCNIADIATGFGATYRRVTTVDDMRHVLATAPQSGIEVVEVLAQ